MLRFKSLISLLEQHKWLRVSLDGLINDYSDAYSILKNAYEELEAYEMMDALENHRNIIDRDFAIFVKNNYPIVVQIQDHYSEEEYQPIIDITEIDQVEVAEIINATK